MLDGVNTYTYAVVWCIPLRLSSLQIHGITSCFSPRVKIVAIYRGCYRDLSLLKYRDILRVTQRYIAILR